MYLDIGLIKDDDDKMRILVDIGDVFITSIKVHHHWVVSQYPNKVAKCL